MAKKTKEDSREPLAVYGEYALKLAPIVCTGIATLSAGFAGFSRETLLDIIIAGTIITILGLILSHRRYEKNVTRMVQQKLNLSFDMYNKIRGEDQKIQGNLLEGLQYVKFISDVGADYLEVSVRGMINNVAYRTILPSILTNHHCSEIASYKEPYRYLINKKRIMHQVFRLALDTKQQELINSLLPTGHNLEMSVESYIHELFREVIAPELIEGCRRKIKVYSSYVEDSGIDAGFRNQADILKRKNESYINMLEQMLIDSAIVYSSIFDRDNSSVIKGCTEDEVVAFSSGIYHKVRLENAAFIKENSIEDSSIIANQI